MKDKIHPPLSQITTANRYRRDTQDGDVNSAEDDILPDAQKKNSNPQAEQTLQTLVSSNALSDSSGPDTGQLRFL